MAGGDAAQRRRATEKVHHAQGAAIQFHNRIGGLNVEAQLSRLGALARPCGAPA